MASYGDLMAIADDVRFQNRCSYALFSVAQTAMVEVNTTPNHQLRVDFAKKIIAGVSLLPIAIAVVLNATVSAEAVLATTPDFAITDAHIQTAVSAAYDILAGKVS